MVTVKVNEGDLQKLNQRIKEQMQYTSKTAEQVLNQKAFDFARFAIKDTPKADAKTIRSVLDAPSEKYPERTVAEILLIKSGEPFSDLQADAKRLIVNKRTRTVGFTKSGWIPGLKALVPYVFKKAATVRGILVGKPKGNAAPAKFVGSNAKASVWNDVAGNPPSQRIEDFKEHGSASAIHKIIADIEDYLKRKLQPGIDKFNRP